MLLATSSSRIFRLLYPILIIGVFLCQIQAQTPKPLLRGKVLDPTRGLIAGAQITAVPDGRTSGPSTVSDQSGEFALTLEPGNYTLKISMTGFLETSQRVSVVVPELCPRRCDRR